MTTREPTRQRATAGPSPPDRSRLALAAPAVVGAVALLVVTRRGAYVSSDALAYLGTARNLAEGLGYASPPGAPPLSNFPPLYPLTLALFAVFGPDPLDVARILNPLLFGVTVLVVGVLARRLTGSLPLAVAAQLLVVSGIDFLAFHSSALSEPLFLLLALAALAALAPGLGRRRPGVLVGAALVASAVVLTRYVGLAVVAAGAGGLILLTRRRGHWMSAVAYGALSLAPLVAWLGWAEAREGRGLNRTPVVHAPGVDYVVDGAHSASTWVLPADVPFPLRGAVAGLVLIALVAVTRGTQSGTAREERPVDGRLARLIAFFAAAYLLALVVDRWLFDVTGRLDARFLLPVHLAAVLLAVRALSNVDLSRSHLARLGLCAVVGLQVASGAFWVYDAATDPAVRPGGFTAPSWRESTVIEQVRSLALTTPVFTNQVDALFLHTGRVAAPLPEKAAFLTGKPNAAYRPELLEMDDRLARGGVVVYFTAAPARRAFLPTPSELQSQLRLQAAARDEVAILLRKGT